MIDPPSSSLEARIQALLDGDLSPEEERRLRAELSATAEGMRMLAEWESLISALRSLPELEPRSGFAEGVMARWGEERHPSSDELQDFVEGMLHPERKGAVAMHLEECEGCRASAAEWTRLMAAFDALPRLSPTDGFADRVMAAWAPEAGSVQAAMAVPAASPSLLDRLASGISGRLPSRRMGWTMVGGIAAAQLSVAAFLLVKALALPFTTPGTLVSVAVWWISEQLGRMSGRILAWTGETVASLVPRIRGIETILSPGVLLGVGILLSALSVGAIWTLYRTFAAGSAQRHHAHRSI